MDSVSQIIIYTWLAGVTMFLGGLLAKKEHFQSKWLELEFRHGVIAFGGGALLSAVCLVLLPDGIKTLSPVSTVTSFLAGSLFFMTLSWLINRSGASAANLVAMLADYIPEAIALGALINTQKESGLLLAILIGLQNFPEGFNAYREVSNSSSLKSSKALLLLFSLSFLGPLFGLIGFWFLSEQSQALGAIMVFASSGILYLIFKDIAPQAQLKNTWLPPFGATLGFLMGLVGHLVLKG